MTKKIKNMRNLDLEFVYEELVDIEGVETGEQHIKEILIKRKGKVIKTIIPLLYNGQYVRGEKEPTSLGEEEFLTLGVYDNKDDYVMDLEEEPTNPQ